MMLIKRFVCNMLQENCYVVSDGDGMTAIIDCGAWGTTEEQAVCNYIVEHGLTPVVLLCTHGHLDHTIGNAAINRQFGLWPMMNKGDVRMYANAKGQARNFYGVELDRELPEVKTLLSDGDTVEVGALRLQVVATPGHSRGSVVFYCQEERVAFTGDTLFRMSIGRTDLDGGHWPAMAATLKRLSSLLPDDTRLLPGHGPETTMGIERKMNPYM